MSVVADLGDAAAAAVALSIDFLGQLGRFELFLLLVVVTLGGSFQAAWLQRRWAAVVARLEEPPNGQAEEPPSLRKLDWGLSLPGLVTGLLTWSVRLPFQLRRMLVRGLIAWWRRRRGAKAGDSAAEPSAVRQRPFLAATLGPSYALAALATAGLYGVAEVAAPWVASSLGLEGGSLAWQIALLGGRAEWGLHLPLDGNPQVAALLSLALWFPVWSTFARLIRGVVGESLGRNLIRERDHAGTLALWRRGFATRQLIAPSRPYLGWAVPLVLVALLGLLAAWFSLGGTSRNSAVRPADFALAWIIWWSWVLHLGLRGKMSSEDAAEESASCSVEAGGWQVVLDDLRERLQVAPPKTFEPPRAIEPLPPAVGAPAGSPLLSELLGEGAGLTAMQQREIARLTRLGHVHLEPPPPPGELTLEAVHTDEDTAAAAARPHRIVLAPEGWGKTTLAFLAAVNQVLVHSRTVLIVVRREEDALAFEDAFRPRLERSALRWNVRLRRLGADLMEDLAQGIVPDVVLADLGTLVTALLARLDRHGQFLRRVGLVVIDDAESFFGPVEVHAQLAFRRLQVALRRAQGAAGTDAPGTPGTLILGRETMHQTGRWMRDLCGVEATVRHDGYSLLETRQRQRAEQAAVGQQITDMAPSSDAALEVGHHQLFYRLADFRTPYGEPIALRELIASCERQAVPWHYRHCGDGRRHLGPSTLDLLEQPEWTTDAAAACVVILAGAWSEVRRELRQLRRAGVDFRRLRTAAGAPTPAGDGAPAAEAIALVTVVEGDADMAFTLRDAGSDLRSWVERLPLPFLRPPHGPAVEAHLATDLEEQWSEVGDLLGVYGHEIAATLQDLARGDLLLAEARTDVAAGVYAYEERLHVRALRRGLETAGPLPARVRQVELASSRRLAVVDRTTLVRLLKVDAEAAHLAYYPGCIFDTGAGRFVVVGTAEKDGVGNGVARPAGGRSDTAWAEEGETTAGDLLAEPILVPEVSSPRRRIRVRPLPSTVEADGDLLATDDPEPVFFGRRPLAMNLRRAEVWSEHGATLRVDAVSGEIRQHHVAPPGDPAAPPLTTEVLHLHPHPLGSDDDGPPLGLAAARLIAAAMRLVLPSLYRGGREALALGLQVEAVEPTADSPVDPVLKPRDSFVFFDLGQGGTGAVRALRRDGIELLLRLTRLVLERVLSHRRLLALYDEWGGPKAVLSAAATVEGAGEEDVASTNRELALRRAALTWLDSRLRPEGGPPTSERGADYDWDAEPGEGDVFDIGRCWYSPEGSVADLLWVKHRWRLAKGGEAALDIAFDRATAEASRFFTEDREVLVTYEEIYEKQCADPHSMLAEGRPWGAPHPVWCAPEGDGDPIRSSDPQGDEGLVSYHVLASAVAAHSRPELEPLARKLRDEAGGGDFLALATWLGRFVQGIPFSLPEALRRGLRPPVSTLLFRRGDCDSKSLLLALLLEHCGIDAGLFVSFSEGHAFVAAAVPEPFVPEDGNAAKRASAAWARLQMWSEAEGLPTPRLWAELPTSPEQEGQEHRLYVPIESTVYSPVGWSQPNRPETWSFLPLAAYRRRVQLDEQPMASDRAEEEAPQ